MKKVLVLVGPTGVGKTDFSIDLAKKWNAEIISGDSIQVFKHLNIGSGKITPSDMQGIPHHGLDILEPKDTYSVADFQAMAHQKIEEISSRGRLPMIVGGTGLYIKACLYDYQFNPQAPLDPLLLKKYEQLSNEELHQHLETIDPKQAQAIHPNNRKRVLRACMIYESTNESKSEQLDKQNHSLIFDAFLLGCTMDRNALYDRINQRVLQMDQLGLEDEVKSLLSQGVCFEDQSMQGIGYREWCGYFNNEKTKEDVLKEIQTHSRQFAKRQYTWFKNQMPIRWVDLTNEESKKDSLNEIERWLQNE